MTNRYGDLICTEQEDLVGTSSELDNDEDAEDDDYYDDETDDGDDEDDVGADDDEDDEFDGLSINEEAEIMRYAIANAAQCQRLRMAGSAIASQQHSNHNPHHQCLQEHHPQLPHIKCSGGRPPNERLASSRPRTESGPVETNNCNYDFATTQSRSNCSDSNPDLSIYNSSEKLIMESNLFESKTRLFGNGIVLLMTTFALLVLLPLYFQQLTLNGERFNVFGATFFLSFCAALVFLFITLVLGVAIKWKIPFHKPPLPWTKLIMISLCYGLSCTLFATSCYQRVPCHLQDPLKGAALVFSLIFYFFFCRKVMGLQRIFSATTAVVGLFIAIDYGLCDEFRCRGTDLTDQFFQSSLNPSAESATEWRSRAVWALLYIVGIAFWSLHIALLESSLVLPSKEQPKFSLKPMSFLKTVSRLVATAEESLPNPVCTPTKPNADKQTADDKLKESSIRESEPVADDALKSHPLHIIVWIHVLSLIVVGLFGWIDVFPVSGPIKSLSRHWSDTENTVLCHFNVVNRLPEVRSHSADIDLELLSNFVPGSASFNETVQKLRRSRRSLSQAINQTDTRASTTPPPAAAASDTVAAHNGTGHSSGGGGRSHRLELHFNYTTQHHNSSSSSETTRTHLNHNNRVRAGSGSASPATMAAAASHSGHSKGDKKSDNSLKRKWFQGLGLPTNNHSNQSLTESLLAMLGGDRPGRSSGHVVTRTEVTGNCGRVQIYAILLLVVYILFAACLVNFLVISESAVFTVCVIAAALPLIGIFWSLFEISFDQSDQTVGLIWAPEVSGELICSLLGTPIVFLGIGLLCRAYFNEQLELLGDQLVQTKSNDSAALPTSFDNSNYYTTYFETGLSNVVPDLTTSATVAHSSPRMIDGGEVDLEAAAF